MIEIKLSRAVEGASLPPLYLRDMCGEDELAELDNPLQLARLVERLSIDADGSPSRPRRAADMTIAELDRASAAIFAHLYGEQIACHVPCSHCGESSEVSFSLWDFIAAIEEEARGAIAALPDLIGPDGEGLYHLGERARFRLPTVGDLAAASASPSRPGADILRERCIAERGETVPFEEVERAMEGIAPLLDTEMNTECAACGAEQVTPFGIAAFLIESIRRERPIIIREVHVLARAYAWSREEILNMPRRCRREHVGLMVAEAELAGVWP
jgi:hypothetical protein